MLKLTPLILFLFLSVVVSLGKSLQTTDKLQAAEPLEILVNRLRSGIDSKLS